MSHHQRIVKFNRQMLLNSIVRKIFIQKQTILKLNKEIKNKSESLSKRNYVSVK